MRALVTLVLINAASVLGDADTNKCYIKGKSKDYNGNIKETKDGVKCLDWTMLSDYPHINDGSFVDCSVVKASNNCRDPSESGKPWCFDSFESEFTNVRQDHSVSKCDAPTECFIEGGDSHSYDGNVQETEDGKKCISWNSTTAFFQTKDENFPDGSVVQASNYCRNPTGNDRPWCFWSFKSVPDYEWSFCNVRRCSESHKEDSNFCLEPSETGRPWCFKCKMTDAFRSDCNVPRCI